MTDQDNNREQQQQREGGPSAMASPFSSFGSLRIAQNDHNNNIDNDDSPTNTELQVDRCRSMDEINISTELELENMQLREELAMMKHQMLRMRTKLKEQQQYISSSSQQSQQQPLTASENSKHQKSSSTAGVLLELPVTMRNSTANSKLKTGPQKQQQEQQQSSLLSCMSRKPPAAGTTSSAAKIQIPNGNAHEKDHSSVSTADDRSTLEAPIDLEAHQSAAGLHHRHNTMPSYTVALKTNHTAISTTQTLKTGPTADDSLSSLDAAYDDDDEMDGLVRVATNNVATPTATHTNPEVGEQMTFCKAVADRAGWLVGLLVFQSLSSFILARNESLLQHHAVIVQFLTMLVGAGGNAGNQASVGVVRGLAVGTINRSNVRRFLRRECAMGVCVSIILGIAGCIRAAVFAVPFLETMAITSSLFMIVIISVVAGALLPLGMQIVGIDPAHSSTTIQVIMDITGVVITVHVSSLVLDSDFRNFLEHAMSLEGETR